MIDVIVSMAPYVVVFLAIVLIVNITTPKMRK